MSKLRVHELAKELNISSKELLNCIDRLGIENKKAASNLDAGEINTVRGFFKKPSVNSVKPTGEKTIEKTIVNKNIEAGNAQKPKTEVSQRKTDTQTVDITKSTQPQNSEETQNRKTSETEGQKTFEQRPQRQDGQRPQGSYQRQDGQRQQGSYQRQDSQRSQGQGYQRQDGQRSQGGYQRDGQRPQGSYQRQDGQRTQGQGYQRDGQRPQGSYQRPQGQGYQRPDGQRPQGQGYQRQDGQRPQGSYQRPDGQRPQGSYQRDGQRPQGSYQRDGQRPQGSYQRDGQRPQGGYQRDGQRPQGSYQRPQGQGYQRPDGQRPQGGYQGQKPYGAQGYRDKDKDQSPSHGQRSQKPGGRGDFRGGKPEASAAKPATKDMQKGIKRFDKTKDKQKEERKVIDDGIAVAKAKALFSKKSTPKPNVKRNAKKEKRKQMLAQKEMEVAKILEEDEEEIKLIQVGKSISVKELADKMKRPTADIIKPLMKIGIMATINQEIDFYTASNIAETFDIIVEEAEEVDILEEAFKEAEDDEKDLVECPPVVVVMGHVDHGKTSLLDSIRKSHVTSGEAGGITQHIGAYTVTANGKPITFLDTPGHEAFTAMRMRGAQVTDIAILVVAADDGVMPQTIEAINHAKAANVEIIVAINKIDKPSANPDRVKQELTEYGILTEDWGGETICVPVSATQRTGIDQLLEMILLVAELREIKANPNKRARGTVIEAQLDKGKGPVATVLIQDGTLSIGDPIVAGSTYGKIRAMMDDKGNKVKKAGPSIPVEIIGLSEAPMAGDMFYVAENDRQARQVSESVHAKGREEMIKNTPQKVSLDDLFNQIQSGNVKDLNIIIKADVQGSVEAVKNSLERLSNDEVRIRTIHGGVGAITETDVMLASTSNAIIIGFNVRPENTAKSVADAEKVDIRLYRIIYNAIEDITAAMKGMLDPEFVEKVTGHAEVRQIFKASGIGTIAGSYVTDGKIARNSKVRVIRDGAVVYEGEIGALKRFKDDVKEVSTNYECGISFANFNDIKEGDQIEAYIMEEIPR